MKKINYLTVLALALSSFQSFALDYLDSDKLSNTDAYDKINLSIEKKRVIAPDNFTFTTIDTSTDLEVRASDDKEVIMRKGKSRLSLNVNGAEEYGREYGKEKIIYRNNDLYTLKLNRKVDQNSFTYMVKGHYQANPKIKFYPATQEWSEEAISLRNGDIYSVQSCTIEGKINKKNRHCSYADQLVCDELTSRKAQLFIDKVVKDKRTSCPWLGKFKADCNYFKNYFKTLNFKAKEVSNLVLNATTNESVVRARNFTENLRKPKVNLQQIVKAYKSVTAICEKHFNKNADTIGIESKSSEVIVE